MNWLFQKQLNKMELQNAWTTLADSELPKWFWAKALSTATYLRNRSPITAVQGKTSYEACTGNKSNVSHLCISECDV